MITHESSLESFSDQLDFVLTNYKDHGFRSESFDHVVLGGLGGSGIGALIAKSWFFDKADLPIEVVNNYDLPAYVNEKSLVVINSYSGNTEESLSLFEQAKATGASILCLTSGGQLQEKAGEENITCYSIPTGYQPRMAIGFGLSYQLLILGDFFDLDQSAALIDIRDDFPNQREKQIRSAEQIAKFFASSLKRKFVILADRDYAEVAVRFGQQINENAKLEAFVNIIPEANHNVLESYVERLETNFIMLYSDRNPRVAARFDFLISHLEMENNRVLPLEIPDYDVFSIFDVIYRLDWVSVMIANELGAPLMEVPIISNLKEFLNDLEIIEEEEE
ncbi:MAG: SIS domain-containing protein [Bacteroidia bacterium]